MNKCVLENVFRNNHNCANISNFILHALIHLISYHGFINASFEYW